MHHVATAAGCTDCLGSRTVEVVTGPCLGRARQGDMLSLLLLLPSSASAGIARI